MKRTYFLRVPYIGREWEHPVCLWHPPFLKRGIITPRLSSADTPLSEGNFTYMYVLLGIYLFSLYFVDRKEINKEYNISFFSKTSTVIFLIIFISLLIPFMVIAYHMEAYNTLFHILTFFVILVLYFIVFQIKKKKNK